ncbi:hypothetical protein SAMN04489806_1841 [Paramicrobacterium humi]|uniref:Uncharacterized protein n=1 Tax=Paramicrobacterium humi TaxID=640635 RepID=A0A1H4ME14_9MICO|nr:hypothetical protein [Microbacterium humi]SEB81249.1 hypothetical protein SAMN04489806_1841 [Microbacterium humi]
MRGTSETVDEFPVDHTRRAPFWLAPTITVAATVAVNGLLLPLWILLMLASARFDSSGQGGPFRSCTADSAMCSGPSFGWIALVIAALAGGALLAAVIAARLTARFTRTSVGVKSTAAWSLPLVLLPALALAGIGIIESLSGA